MKKTYTLVEEYNPNEVNHRLRLAQAINDTRQGNIDCIRDMVIPAGQTTQVVIDNRINYFSAIIITSMNEAGYQIRNTMREIERGKGSVMFNFNAPSSEARMRLVILG